MQGFNRVFLQGGVCVILLQQRIWIVPPPLTSQAQTNLVHRIHDKGLTSAGTSQLSVTLMKNSSRVSGRSLTLHCEAEGAPLSVEPSSSFILHPGHCAAAFSQKKRLPVFIWIQQTSFDSALQKKCQSKVGNEQLLIKLLLDFKMSDVQHVCMPAKSEKSCRFDLSERDYWLDSKLVTVSKSMMENCKIYFLPW